MTAYNVVRFRVKPGFEEQFVEAHRVMTTPFKGFLGADLVKTGERTYCFVGRWGDLQNIVDARSQMIALLDTFREMLEDLGGGLGVTDPISGSSVARLGPREVAKKRAAKPKAASNAKASKGKTSKAKARTVKAKKKQRSRRARRSSS